MGRERYPRSLRQVLLLGAALAAATALLFSLLFALFGATAVWATAGGFLAVMVAWDVAVERPRREDRLEVAFAIASLPGEDGLPGARAGRAHWSDRLPGPLGAAARYAPATAAALVIIGIALAINTLLGRFDTGDRDSDVYVLMRTGAVGHFAEEGAPSPSLRVTLHTTLDRPELENPSLTADPYRQYWAAQVTVENTGAGEISVPAWRLRARGTEYGPTRTSALGPELAGGFTLAPGELRTGWIAFEIRIFATPEWLRAQLPGYPDLYFASRETLIEKR